MDKELNSEKNTEKKHRNRRRRRPMHKKVKEQKLQSQEIHTEPASNEVTEKTVAEVETVQEAAPTVKVEEIIEDKYRVVGIRFRPVGKTYSFDPGEENFQIGDRVIVETSQGTEFGTVSTPPRMALAREVVLPLKKVLRPANENDIARYEENRQQELKGRKIFLEKVAQHGLDMALSDVECSFDRSKMIFYFTSEGRVDFREFVKDLASIFKTRIELRQIGVRDEAKQLGGLGICGRPLCCSSFLEDFQQVSIKMAKEQNLSLNPTKISGTCGRLMCCLRYENDVYVEAAKKCPKADSAVMTPKGKGVVVESNILCGQCKVRLESDPDNIVPFIAEELKVIPKQKKPQGEQKSQNNTSADGQKEQEN